MPEMNESGSQLFRTSPKNKIEQVLVKIQLRKNREIREIPQLPDDSDWVGWVSLFPCSNHENLFTHFVCRVSPTRTVPMDLIMYKINLYTFSNAQKKTDFREKKNPSFFLRCFFNIHHGFQLVFSFSHIATQRNYQNAMDQKPDFFKKKTKK